MTTNTNPHNVTIAKNADTGKWQVQLRRTFTNYRLVHLGREAYTDTRWSTANFNTRKKAIAYATTALDNGWSIQSNRDGLLILTTDTTGA